MSLKPRNPDRHEAVYTIVRTILESEYTGATAGNILKRATLDDINRGSLMSFPKIV